MKHTLIVIASLFMFLTSGLAEDPSELARQRDEQVQRQSQDLKELDAQISQFESGLAAEQKSSVDLQAQETTLLSEGKKLAADAHDMMTRDKAYGVEVKQQIAECPENTTDPALAQRCREWKAKLDKEQKEVKAITRDWTDRKDKFLAARTRLDQERAANRKAIDHFNFSIPNMKIQRDRILNGLWGINAEVKKCRDAIQGASEEHMHAVCGQMWDGNKMYPEFSPELPQAKKP
jgi:chromosome segregation ATPase